MTRSFFLRARRAPGIELDGRASPSSFYDSPVRRFRIGGQEERRRTMAAFDAPAECIEPAKAIMQSRATSSFPLGVLLFRRARPLSSVLFLSAQLFLTETRIYSRKNKPLGSKSRFLPRAGVEQCPYRALRLRLLRLRAPRKIKKRSQ